jgi:hypothetical protein
VKRRDFLKGLVALPLVASLGLPVSGGAVVHRRYTEDACGYPETANMLASIFGPDNVVVSRFDHGQRVGLAVSVKRPLGVKRHAVVFDSEVKDGSPETVKHFIDWYEGLH